MGVSAACPAHRLTGRIWFDYVMPSWDRWGRDGPRRPRCASHVTKVDK